MAQRRIYGDITETMGDTPLIQLNLVGAGGERYLSNPVYAELPDPDYSDIESALA